MSVLYSNNAISSLASAITSTTATSLTLATGTGTLFPSPTGGNFFYATLVNGASMEIVQVTAVSGDTFTIVRGQDGTTAQTFPSGTAVQIYITKAMLDQLKIDAVAAGYPGTFTTISASGQLTLTNASGYNLYASGAAPNYFAGAVGVGNAPYAGNSFQVSKNITGASNSSCVSIGGTIQSDVTGIAYGAGSYLSTAAASFTLGALKHFSAAQNTIGAGSTVTNQYGFSAETSLTGATNNFGFYSNIASGTNRWNFYAAGTASNYFAGQLGVGVVAGAANEFQIGGTLPSSSAISRGVNSNGTIPSTTTNQAVGYLSNLSTAAASFTLTTLQHFNATQSTIGSGSTVTGQYGFFADSTLTGATNNYGFYSNIASGTGRYNFYAAGTADNAFFGSVGIGGAPAAGKNVVSYKAMTGGAGYAYAFNNESVINSDTTAEASSFQSFVSTQAAAFTLAQLRHFKAYQNTIGSGSTVTNQHGFFADPSLTGATNNYGFYSNIASATGAWNFYAAGTASNYFAGAVGVGGTLAAGVTLNIGKSITGATQAYGVVEQGQVQSDVTAGANLFSTNLTTAVAAFTLNNARHFQASQGAIGSGSAVNNQYGFYADSTLTGATNNYGFYSNIASATGAWNFYAAGTASNYFAGSVGIGVSPIAGQSFSVAKQITGGVYSMGVRSVGTIQSDVTTQARAFDSGVGTAAASFTLGSLVHYYASPAAFGSGSTVTNQFGFNVETTLTGATNNYGFYSNIASGTGRWNFYAAGTADNYFAGNIYLGNTATNANFYNSKLITGAVNSYGFRLVATGDSTVTSNLYGYSSALSTTASAYTLASLSNFIAFGGTTGAGSTLTNQYGYSVDTSLTGATNNYGFYSNIASGTGRYNFYAAGSAANYFAGDLTIYGGTAVPAGGTAGVGYKFSSTSNLGVFFGSGAPTLSAAQGSLYVRTDGSSTSTRLYVNTNGSTTWTNVTTAA
jgi:hypothetical protein